MPKIRIILIGCVILSVFACAFAVIGGVYLYDRGNKTQVEVEDNGSEADENTNNYAGEFNPNYEKKEVPEGVEAYERPMLELILDAARLAKEKDWNGKRSSDLPFSYKDFDQTKLANYEKEFEEYKKREREIPSDRRDLFYGDQADREINQVLEEARKEYLAFLKAKNVNQRYIDEIETHVFPEGEEYLKYGIGNGGSLVDGYKRTDYSKRQMVIDGNDINKVMDEFLRIRGHNEPMFGEDIKWNRDMAARMIIYHEMTHVLQQAYINEHVSEETKAEGSRFMWRKASKTLIDADKKHFWEWQDNKVVSEESQADGVMMFALAHNFNLTEAEQQKLWDHWHGRENENANTVYEIGKIFHEEFPDYLNLYMKEFGEKVYEDTFDGYGGDEDTIKEMLEYSTRIDAYQGYFNPMTEEESESFWKELEE